MPLKLFATKAKQAPPVHESIGRLRDTLEVLEKRENYLQTKVQNELMTAKKNANTNKKAALMALKRKKQYESQIEKLSGARLTIEQQMMTIENAQVSLQAMRAMQQGARTMRTIHNHMTVDQVDDTMDEIREQMDIANEINDAISQPLGADLYDDDELEEELAQLQEEEDLAGLEQEYDTPIRQPKSAPVVSATDRVPDSVLSMPSAPTGKLVAPTSTAEDDELAALQAEFGL